MPWDRTMSKRGAPLCTQLSPNRAPLTMSLWAEMSNRRLRERWSPLLICDLFTLTVPAFCLSRVCASEMCMCSDRQAGYLAIFLFVTVTTAIAGTIWRRFQQLTDDLVWAAERNLPGKPFAFKGHGCTPLVFQRTVLPRKTHWKCTKFDPEFAVIVSLHRRHWNWSGF